MRLSEATLEDVFVAVTLTSGEREMMSLSRIMAIVKKEVRQLRRDRLTFGMVVGLPIIQMLLFGYAINTDVRQLKTAVADQAGTHLSRQFIAELAQTQVVDIVESVETVEGLNALLRRGRSIHRCRHTRRFRPPRQPSALAPPCSCWSMAATRRFSALRISYGTCRSRSTSAHSATSLWQFAEVRPYYNPERRTPVNIIPGLMGVILTMTMILFTAVALVRERERGNLELLINTPLSSTELMIGKVIPYIVIGMLQLALILGRRPAVVRRAPCGAASSIFTWRHPPSWPPTWPSGLLISTAATTQFQAMQMMVFILLPSILLSWLHVPVRRHASRLPNTSARRCRTPTSSALAVESCCGRPVWAKCCQTCCFSIGFTLVAMAVAAARFSKRLD